MARSPQPRRINSYDKAGYKDKYQYEAREEIRSTPPTTERTVQMSRPEPTVNEMSDQLGAVMRVCERCLAAYGKVWGNIDDLDKTINSEPALKAIGRLCKDLNAWAKLTGVYSEGKVSLDDTIRASPNLRDQVLKHVLEPLRDIEVVLQKMIEIAQEKAARARERLVSGSAHIPTTEDGSSSRQHPQETELEQAVDLLAESQGRLGI